MPFADFEKQFPLLTSSLKRAKLSGQMPHSYIVHGDNPEMREKFSLALAQTAACPKSDASGDACGKCRVCDQLERKCHPDLFILAPNSKSRKIRIGNDADDPDTIREFQSFFHLSPTIPGGKKIGIILDADRIQMEGQNAFLKTLEEPPGNSLFILCTAKPAFLLPTVRSRCQMLPLLTNKCDYGQAGLDAVPPILCRLAAGHRSLQIAGECAAALNSIAGELHKKAEKTVEDKKGISDQEMENMEAPARKRYESRMDAEIEAEYLKLRSYFLSLIHCWFSQVYLMSCGIQKEQLPNLELFTGTNIPRAAFNEDTAYVNLKKAEDLLQNLNWNVKEDLAISEFCISVSIPTPASA